MNLANAISQHRVVLRNYLRVTSNESSVNREHSCEKKSSSIKVLVVEDSEICQKIVLLMLGQPMYATNLAVTGKEALVKYQQGYDVILMDLGLPDMSGLEICREIRKEKNAAELPIIAYSTISDSLRQECLDVGFNEALMKPAGKNLLDKVIKSLVKYK